MRFVEMAGTMRHKPARARIEAPADGREMADLVVRLRPKTPFAPLHDTVDAIYAQPPDARRYLTREELAASYGADAADLDALTRLAAAYGLTVAEQRHGERLLVLRGTLDALRCLFPAELRQCKVGHTAYRGRLGAIQVPEVLADIVTGVFGYDTRPKLRATRAVRLAAHAGAQPGGGQAAAVYARRYNFPDSHAGTTLDGARTCIGIIELGGNFRADDLHAYCGSVGVLAPRIVYLPPSSAASAGAPVGGGDAEVMLDVEIAAGIAPAATLALYFADNQNSGLLQAVSQAVHDATNKPNVLCISWGGPECLLDGQSLQAFGEIFTAAAALGIVVCAASGDHGVADLDALHWDGVIHVDHPAADPRVLACGGTQIVAAGGDEVVWNDGTPFDITAQTGGWASGGGISACQPVPAYQQGVALPPALDGSGKPGRGVPDIAMIAVDHQTVLGGQAGASRGTSAVAPLMAGLAARLVQARGGNVGCLNGLLYSSPSICTPVRRGDNGIADTINGYQAQSGWSACTGLGTPDGSALLQAVLGTANVVA